MKFTHSNNTEIKTKRLLLRRFRLDDAQDMLDNWIADPLVQNEYGEPVYESKAEVAILIGKWIKQYDNSNLYRWAVILAETDTCIGQIAFCRVYIEDKTVEAEYCIGRNYWGNGYATEALQAVIKHVFLNTDFGRLEAFVRNENPKSGSVLLKAGMNKATSVRRFEIEKKQPEGKTCYAIAKSGFNPE